MLAKSISLPGAPLALSAFTLLAACEDPRTGGLRGEIRAFQEDLDRRTWEACGEDPDAVDYLNLKGGALGCHGRLYWSLGSCEVDTLMKYPDAAREHLQARLVAHSGVVRCCEAGGPGLPERRGDPMPCTAQTVDACIAYENNTMRASERVVSPGLDLYYADDNLITDEVEACFDLNGWTRQSSILPRVCDKLYICPNSRAVTQCYADNTCDGSYEEITRCSPWYNSAWYKGRTTATCDKPVDPPPSPPKRDAAVDRDARITLPSLGDARIQLPPGDARIPLPPRDASTVKEPGDTCDSTASASPFGVPCQGCGESTCVMPCTNGTYGECVGLGDLLGGLGDAGLFGGGIVLPEAGIKVPDAGIKP